MRSERRPQTVARTALAVLDELIELPVALLLPPPGGGGAPWLRGPRGYAGRARRLERRIHEGQFQRALSMVAGGSGLLAGLEVALQHYRGSYNQRIMYSPVLLSVPFFAAGVVGAFHRTTARRVLPIVSAALVADGVIGFGFHVRGIARKPGGFRIPVTNIVMGPPIFAPLLLGIGGFLGLIASVLEREDDPRPPFMTRVRRAIPGRRAARNRRLQQWFAAATAVSALLNGFEALYSHYKSGFGMRSQWIPVVLAPAITATAGVAMVRPTAARRALPSMSLLAIAAGGVGFFYHVRGVVRRPGGTTMPLYNLVYGPPALAPLLFAATGFLGLLASQLRRAHP